MKTFSTTFLCLLLATLFMGEARGKDFTRYVNPNIGVTHSRWFFYTPAAMPFGLAKLGPSTNGTYGNNQGWEAVGYQDDHRSIDGFPCLHEFQVGGISLMPVTGEVKTVPGRVENPAEGFRSAFDKQSEIDRKSTRLNSSHANISYAVFCLKKKKKLD